ncbi:AMP-dependent synthetase [Klebsiella sp. NPDC088457]
MTLPLSMARWLNAPRPADTLVAWRDDRVWTLGHLRDDVARWAEQLLQHPGQRWALCFDDSYLFLVALLATLHAHKTPVIPGHNRLSLLEEQRALFDGVLSDTPLGWSGPAWVISSARRSPPQAVAWRELADDACIELFTSGSTGQPKRISKSLACLDREAALLATRFAARLESCRIVASVVPQHLYGLTFRIILPMALSLPLHAAMLHYAEQLSALNPRHRYAFISSPAFLKRLDPRLIPPPVAAVFSAGGLLPWENVTQAAGWLKCWPDEIYGSTETGVLAWRCREQEHGAWQPFPGVRFIAQGPKIRVFSPLIADRDGLLLDDTLQFTEDGQFRLIGRQGRVVKIEEKRVSLSEIERRLLELEGICEAAAIPVSHAGRQGVGVLLVLDESTRQEWHSAGRALEQRWRQALRPTLEPVAIPRYWRIIDEIPVNSMNKRVYAQLQELFHETP